MKGRKTVKRGSSTSEDGLNGSWSMLSVKRVESLYYPSGLADQKMLAILVSLSSSAV